MGTCVYVLRKAVKIILSSVEVSLRSFPLEIKMLLFYDPRGEVLILPADHHVGQFTH